MSSEHIFVFLGEKFLITMVRKGANSGTDCFDRSSGNNPDDLPASGGQMGADRVEYGSWIYNRT